MKEVLHNFSTKVEDGFLKPFGEKALGAIKKHPDVFCLLLLGLLCLVFLFFGLNFYPLMDVDETRYAVMSRDLIHSFDLNSLMLNYEPFLEKPPLYFWLVGGSIKLLGQFSAFAVRLPIALSAAFITFFTYFVGKKVISRKFGMLSALVLVSSIFFLILAHVAILDMILTVFMTSTIYCGFMTHFCQEKYKKYFWWYFWLFAGVGFLAKGILAIAIPSLILFIYNLITKTLKEMFKPINFLPGLLIFLVVIIPWHLLMYMEYGNKFIKEYILLHHFARFINSESIGRQRPFWYFIPVFLFGFMPWSLIFIAAVMDGFKKLVAKYKNIEGNFKSKISTILDVQTNEQKLILFASIYFIVVFLVFSSSSTKLPTYILPIFPAAALITGYFWWVSDEKSEHQKAIDISTNIFATLFVLTAASATIAYYFLPINLQYKMESFRLGTICGLYLLSMLLLLRLKTKRALSVFSAYIFTMFFIISLSVVYIFNLVYSGGENEIVQFASMAKNHSAQLVTFDFAVKPSAMINYTEKVAFLTDPDFDALDKTLKYQGGPTFVIVKNVNLEDKDYDYKIRKRLNLAKSGERYSLYVKYYKRGPKK